MSNTRVISLSFVIVLVVVYSCMHKGLQAVIYSNTSCMNENLISMSLVNVTSKAVTKNFVNIEVKEWSPLQIPNGDAYSFGSYALIILNTPICLDPDQMISLWNKAELRIAVDGGTDRWYEFCKNRSSECLIRKDPEIVIGNLHSINNVTLQACYNNNNITVIKSHDSENTDFTKAIELAREHSKNLKLNSVVVIVEHSGNLHHVMFNFDTLHKSQTILNSEAVVFILTSNSLSWLLIPGFHNIHIPMRVWQSNVWCGLIPLRGPALVKTTGLKWNLENQIIQFGGLISTSNKYGDMSFQREGVTITTDNVLLWIMGLSTEDYESIELACEDLNKA